MDQQAIQHHNKATITKNAQGLFSILMKAFDLRRQLGVNSGTEDSNELYDLVDKMMLGTTDGRGE